MSAKKELTKKQKRVLLFLEEFIQKHGFPPTVREIAQHLDMSGPHSAKRFLDILQEKGFIRRLAKSSRAIEMIHSTTTLSPIRMVPLIGRVRAGKPLLAQENIETTLALDNHFARWKNLFLLRVVGESMVEAHINDGDLALVKSQPTIDNGEIAVILIDDEATIKRFFKYEGTIRLEPANPSMKPILIKPGDSDVTIVGKVVGILRTIGGPTIPQNRSE
jgi:repressor LexA